MKRLLCAACAALAFCSGSLAAEDEDDVFELDRWYAGAGATLVLPQGGGEMRRLGGATARFGYYVTEFWALDFAADWCEDHAAVSGGALWHWWGYERFDPFFTFGLRDWIETDAGPYGGAGAFYHLDDHWSLRFDFSAMLGVENGEMVYSLCAGIQRSW